MQIYCDLNESKCYIRKTLQEMCYDVLRTIRTCELPLKLGETEKVIAQNIKRRGLQHSKDKIRHGVANLKKIETD